MATSGSITRYADKGGLQKCVYYGAMGTYYLATPIIGVARLALVLTHLGYHATKHRQYDKLKFKAETNPKAWTGVFTQKDVTLFWLGQLMRAVTEIALPLISAVFWALKDFLRVTGNNLYQYQKPNFFGMDTIKEHHQWYAEINKLLKTNKD